MKMSMGWHCLRRYLAVGWILACSVIAGGARTLYVSPAGQHIPPFTNGWNSAATNIIEACVAAAASDLVLVTNDTYYLTNQVSLAVAATVRSWNNGALDPTNTVLNGQSLSRCVYLNHANALLAGFRLTNGLYNGSGGGGGTYVRHGTVSNCIIMGNRTTNEGTYGGGAGVFLFAPDSRVRNSVISGNVSSHCGGGIIMSYGGECRDCIITHNTAVGIDLAYDAGGGVYTLPQITDIAVVQNCLISNNWSGGRGGGIGIRGSISMGGCTIIGNSCYEGGGGIYAEQANASAVAPVSISNCTVSGNSMTRSNVYVRGGGGVWVGGYNLILRNTLIVSNGARDAIGGGIFISGNTNIVVSACTIADNTATNGGGVYQLSALNNPVYNSVVYYNQAGKNADVYSTDSNMFAYSCSLSPLAGPGNTTNDPQFANSGGGDYRLTAHSPCVNTGSNETWMAAAFDLDGRLRLDWFSGKADMGAYEFVPPCTLFSVR